MGQHGNMATGSRIAALARAYSSETRRPQLTPMRNVWGHFAVACVIGAMGLCGYLVWLKAPTSLVVLLSNVGSPRPRYTAELVLYAAAGL